MDFFASSGYLIFLITSAAIYAIFGLGLNVQWGFTGLINFGHVAFMAIGAYSTALLTLQGVPMIISVLVGMGLSALFPASTHSLIASA